ncbi:MAG TPA: DUF4175 family protein [Thermoanaerobaculia bacterium]|nr:DUF4175 family protein [Thermoanaerobaculia bacterium]
MSEAAWSDERLPYQELLRVVRSVRRRWRLRVLLRGLVIVLGIGFVTFAASVFALDYFLYTDRAVRLFRALTWITLLALAVRFLVVPLLQKVPNRRVALYIEENEPSLRLAVISAVELAESGWPERTSPVLSRRLIETAIERCEEIELTSHIERSRLRRFSGALAGIAGAGALAVLLSPAFLQHGALLLFAPWKAAADNPYRIGVSPGDVKVPRGSDQRIAARLYGFDAQADLLVRDGEGAEWRRLTLTGTDASDLFGPLEHGRDFELILLDLRTSVDYRVEASGVRSPVHTLTVTDIPYVERIDLEIRFPSYTGLAPLVVEDGGDIAALVGSEARLEVTPTIPVAGGWLRLEGRDDVALEPGDDGRWTATLAIDRNGYYRVDLLDVDGNEYRASPEMSIEALRDQPPLLRINQPGRDVRATKIDEVFVEVGAEDDYGLDRVELVYSVNGTEEQTATLYRRTGARGQKEVAAGHTFFLEEIELRDGDFVSYYARAVDGNRFGGSQGETSDIYFIEIRPFGQQYRRADNGGMGGGGGGGELDSSLSLRQREIVAATFRLIRDREDFASQEYRENLATVGLMQGRLREQVMTLITRMNNRSQLSEDESFKKLVEELTAAMPEMVAAEKALGEDRTGDALGHEQRALTFLQRAEATFRDVRVGFDQGGGGGGRASQLSEDLADLFELELDKLRNQYEVVQRGQEEQVSNQVDEALQKLQELARRQQQENERRARMRGQQTGGSGGSQQQLIDETEELARKLERLAREQARPELRETARRLQEAADSMRRNASQGQAGGSTSASGIQALERLQEAKRLLDKNRDRRLGDGMNEVGQRAQRVSELQQRIQQQIDQLAGQQGQQGQPGQQGQQGQQGEPGQQGREGRSAGARGAAAGSEEMQRLLERKNRLQEEVEGLEQDLDRLAREAREEDPGVARELQGAANSVRKNQLKEKIRYSRAVVENRDPEYARMFEGEISKNIDELMERIEGARGAMGGSEKGQQEDALSQARRLVESLESLEGRLRERGEGEDPQSSEQGREQGSERGSEQGRGDGQGEGEGERRSRLGERGDQPGEAEGGRASAGAGQGGQFSRMGPSDGGSFQPGAFSSEELRQLERELEQRLRDAQELRQGLRQQGVDVGQLDDVIGQMRRFDIRGLNNDPLALDALRDAVVEGLRQFEFSLWRQLEGGDQRIRLSGDDQVPPGYEERVEEYFRALAREGRR